ncbi:leucine-rich repeat protein 1-like [Eriocheir sinensis]|uniref:leucine-rich repeat protein 1-like n=1 Tax=Eriocheir sinensis TaxID=95602 RepID=UPI0021C5B7C0|nr:leucine-rich repeat protein 1-like [Eriocheir sinensis]XP_050739529.1 leucine-rich repeat protein 1-like [Eriocheir sinensis]XP_050739530.1 leucine-rich repeat protein 1-like [Eriocheir sinensis]XP_050739531.1 leucine-rich repeat protein 1-like [Eriocheir sinensis]
MRISCEVQVNNRRMMTLGSAGRRRGSQSTLGIGHAPGAPAHLDNLFVHLCTAQNKQGTKYKVSGNIEAVFTKFVSEGKFTIRFKEPEEDLSVKADPVLAKSFLHTLKAGLANRNLEKLHLSNLCPAKSTQLEKPRTRLAITKRSDYPLATGFPRTLEELRINKIQLSRIEARIVKLPRLHTLDLGLNQVSVLPIGLGSMSSLTHLDLRENHLSAIPAQVFAGSLRNTLVSLDLAQNLLTYLPHTITSLHNLLTLRLDGNRLIKLPLSLGKLTNLRCLSVSNNKLIDLPASVRRLRLNMLEVCENPFTTPLGIVEDRLAHTTIRGPPSLREIVARVCVKKSLRPSPADIPATLVQYLEGYTHCLCGRPCFESHLLAVVPLDLERLSTSIVVKQVFRSTVPAMAALCSQRCWEMSRKR